MCGRRGKLFPHLFWRAAGSNRHIHHFHRGTARAAERSIRRAAVKHYWPVVLVVALLAIVPFVTTSNVVLNFLITTLLIALVGQGWNLLGGYGGQYSFGHAAFFGTAAYTTAILQVRYGVHAWLGVAAGNAAGGPVGG